MKTTTIAIFVMSGVIVFQTTWLLIFWRVIKQMNAQLMMNTMIMDAYAAVKEASDATREEPPAAHRSGVDGDIGG